MIGGVLSAREAVWLIVPVLFTVAVVMVMARIGLDTSPPAHRCAAPIVAGPRVVTCEAFEVRTCHQIGKQWACSPWVAEFEQPLWNRGVR